MSRERRPQPDRGDDGPEPYRTTPKRVSHQVEQWAVELASSAVRGRKLGIYTRDPRIDEAVNTLLDLVRSLTDLSAGVLVGRVELTAEFVDPAHRPARPLLDAIESKAKGNGTVAGKDWTDAHTDRLKDALDLVVAPPAAASKSGKPRRGKAK